MIIYYCKCFLISDFEKPVILNMSANITQYSFATAVVSWVEPYATDNSGSQTLTSSHSPGSSFVIGHTPVVYTSVDLNGNKATKTFYVDIKGR